MTHPNRRVQDVEIEARRARVASMLLGGVTSQRAIAESLNASEATISRDVKAIEKQWQASAVQDIAAAKGKDLERTERLIAALWNDARNGKWLATDRVLNLMQHRAKLLGLEAPQRREDTHRIEVQHIVQGIAESSGLDAAEILAEAERIVKAAQ
jgi:transposase